MKNLVTRNWKRLVRLWFTLCHRSSFKKFGQGVFFEHPFRIVGASRMEIGDRTVMLRGGWLYCVGVDGIQPLLKTGNGCMFGYNNHITCVREVVIGDSVLTANNVYISDNLHGYEDISRPIIDQPVRFKRSVSIGSGSWIGENVCIIGASIGKNCVIGANAVVTRDIPDYSVAVGSPAAVIKQFDFEQQAWAKVVSDID